MTTCCGHLPDLMKRRHFIKHALAGAALAAAGRSLRGESSEPALGPNKALEVAGTKAASPTFYRRMFPGLRPKYSRPRPDIEKGLKDLGERWWIGIRRLTRRISLSYRSRGILIWGNLLITISPWILLHSKALQTRLRRRRIFERHFWIWISFMVADLISHLSFMKRGTAMRSGFSSAKQSSQVV